MSRESQESGASLSPGDKLAARAAEILDEQELTNDTNSWDRSWVKPKIFGLASSTTRQRGFARRVTPDVRLDLAETEKTNRVLGRTTDFQREIHINLLDSENGISTKIEFSPIRQRVKISNQVPHLEDKSIALPRETHEYQIGDDFYDQTLALALSYMEELHEAIRSVNETG